MEATKPIVKSKKLLIITDSPVLTTGLSRICKEVATRLYNKVDENGNKVYDVAVAGWHQQQTRHNFPFYIYQFSKELSVETENQLGYIISDFNPDIVLCIGDIWDFLPASRVFIRCREINENFKACLWVTVDGEWTNLNWNEVLTQFDTVASMSKFGLNEIHRLNSRFKDNVIYPGVDSEIFKKLALNLDSKDNQIDIKNTFVLVNIGQNCDRKNIPATIDAFAEFQKDKKDVFLFLGTNPDAPTGHHIWAIIKRHNLMKSVSVVKNINPVAGVEDAKLNLLYNMCKVNINSSIGEGLGIPIIEGMASGCIPIVTDYAATPEIVENCGYKVNVAEHIYGAYGVVRAVISKKDLVDKLNILYYDWKKYKDVEDKSDSIYFQLSKKCIEKSKEFIWDKTAERVHDLINQAVIQEKKRDFIKNNIKLEDLKLLMVIPSWGKNCGIAEYAKSLGFFMEYNGTKVTVYPSNNLSELEKYFEKFNCIYIQHEFSFFQDRTQLESFLDKARAAKVKTVVLMHSFAPLYPYLNMVIDKADVLIFHNETFKTMAMKQRPDAKNIRVIPMGCLPAFKGDNSEVRNALKINNNHPIIGSFGFLRDQKGYNELVLAIKEMREQYKDIKLIIVAPPHEFGSKSYDENFFNFILDNDMQDNVIIIREFLDDEKLLKTLNACDLFVLNYKDNPTMGGNSAACKTLLRICKPVIAPNSIAFLDIKDEVIKINGLNKIKIKENIEKVLHDKELYEKVSQNAEAFIKKCDWSKVAQQHIVVCRD